MYKAIIVDDEPLARSVIVSYLKAFEQLSIVDECDDGFAAYKAILKHKPDLVFLDVQMPKITGFELLELIETDKPEIIFTTAYDEFALKAFEIGSVDYLLKPFNIERFGVAVEKFLKSKQVNDYSKSWEYLQQKTSKQPEEKSRVVVKVGGEIQLINANDIHFIEAYDDYVKINTLHDCFLKKKTMAYYEETLNEQQFLRVHRSFLINVTQLTKIEPLEKNTYLAILKSGKKLPMSRAGYLRTKTVLGL
jgi:two-component system, LytTR family, response regulator